MKIEKTIYNHNLRKPDSIKVICGSNKKTFNQVDDLKAIGNYIKSIWEEEKKNNFGLFFSEAYIYYNIDWDCDNILFCKYTARTI